MGCLARWASLAERLPAGSPSAQRAGLLAGIGRGQRPLQGDGTAHALGIDGDLREPRSDLRRDLILCPAAEVAGIELLHRRDHCKVVDGTRKAVTLVRGDQIFNWLS